MVLGHRRILIAVDGSEDADQVLEAATALYPKGNDSFFVVTVVSPLVGGMTGMGGASFAASWPLHDMEATIRKEVTDTVCERVARFGIPPDRVAVRYGRPAAETVAYADQLGADLIVVGSHGRHGLPRVMLGSTANGILHGAKCDVLTIRITD
jgi:universal stress protein A